MQLSARVVDAQQPASTFTSEQLKKNYLSFLEEDEKDYRDDKNDLSNDIGKDDKVK